MLEQLKRFFRHAWAADASDSFSPEAMQRLHQCVTDSEKLHSGEIRICIESRLPNSYLWRSEPLRTITRQRAIAQFGKLRVWDTEHNNGVLIYLLLVEHAIEIVTDRGLNNKVAPEFWRELVQRLGASLKAGQFEQGLTLAVDEVSNLLVTHFPLASGEHNTNELPDAPLIH